MPEINQEVRPVRTQYMCDNCRSGLMRPTGIVLMTHPAQYPHECCNCGCRQNFRSQYPRISYELVETETDV